MNYDNALNKQRSRSQAVTPIAGAPIANLHWIRDDFQKRMGFGRQAVPTVKAAHGNTTWRIPEYVLERVGDPNWRTVEVWAPAHIMRQALGCDIFVLGVEDVR